MGGRLRALPVVLVPRLAARISKPGVRYLGASACKVGAYTYRARSQSAPGLLSKGTRSTSDSDARRLLTFGFLTTEANADVAAFHDKAMPVILTKPEEWDAWLSDKPWTEVAHLQRKLPNGALKIVARGTKEDPAGAQAGSLI